MWKENCFVDDIGDQTPQNKENQAKPSLCASVTVLQTGFAETALNTAVKST